MSGELVKNENFLLPLKVLLSGVIFFALLGAIYFFGSQKVLAYWCIDGNMCSSAGGCYYGGSKFYVGYNCAEPNTCRDVYCYRDPETQQTICEPPVCYRWYCNCPDSPPPPPQQPPPPPPPAGCTDNYCFAGRPWANTCCNNLSDGPNCQHTWVDGYYAACNPSPPPPPPPPPCNCQAPSSPTITGPANNATNQNPDGVVVTWNTPGSWGIDTGTQPYCSNSGGNDYIAIYYRKTAGDTSDTPPSGATLPGVAGSGGWRYVQVAANTNSYTLYNLDGGSTYSIYVRAENGCSGSNTATVNITTGYRPQVTSVRIPYSPICPADPTGTRWSGRTNLGEYESDREHAATNPVTISTYVTDRNGGSDVGFVVFQIDSTPNVPGATYDALRVMYVHRRTGYTNDSFYVWNNGAYQRTTSASQVSNQYFRLIMDASDPSTANTAGNQLIVNWRIEFKDSFRNAKHSTFVYAEDISGAQDRTSGTVTTISSGNIGSNWHTHPIANGSAQGFWGVDTGLPGGDVSFQINQNFPTQAFLKYKNSDTQSGLFKVFKRQFKRYLNDEDPATQSWQYYNGVGGTSSSGWQVNVNNTYWPGPTSTQQFNDEFNQLQGGNYIFRVLGEDYGCNVGAGPYTAQIQAPWLRTRAGEVYSNSYIDVTLPSAGTESYLATYLVSYLTTQSKVVGAVSLKDFEISQYDEAHEISTLASTLNSRVRSKGLDVQTLTNPDNDDWWDTIYSATGNVFSVKGTGGSSVFTIKAGKKCPRKIITLITGDLIINPNFQNEKTTSACMFIVTGNVYLATSTYTAGTVSSGTWTGVTEEFDASFVVSDTLYTTEYEIPAGQKYAPPTNKLLINGLVIAQNGQFNRNLGNDSNNVIPSDEIVYDPRHLVLLADFLGFRKQRFYECGIVDIPECEDLNQ